MADPRVVELERLLRERTGHLIQLRHALRCVMAFVDRGSAGDYDAWLRLLEETAPK